MPLDLYIKECKRLIADELFVEAPRCVLSDYTFTHLEKLNSAHWMRESIRKHLSNLET